MQDVLYEKKGYGGWIIINRPERRNAFRYQTVMELRDALRIAISDNEVAAVVITGAGGEAFCAGGDIEEMKEFDARAARDFLFNFAHLLFEIRTAPKVVIAAINGYCLGGGNEINLACDLSVATEGSVFGQTGPAVGASPVMGGPQLLPFIVGDKKAREIMFLCYKYSAREAEKMGWINRVVPDGALENAVTEWVEQIARLSPQALRIAKETLNLSNDRFFSSLLHAAEVLALTYESDEFQEGMRAFLEKRHPHFRKSPACDKN